MNDISAALPDSATFSLKTREFDRLVRAARDRARVSGLTHNFYRYPARFSPKFVREVIEVFSAPGDLVLDPFMGGGTTLVEAVALGRRCVGTDISSLAAFVTQVKTTLLSEADIAGLQEWSKRIDHVVAVRRKSRFFADYAEKGYYRHLTGPETWRLRKAIEQALASAIALGPGRREAFARCVVLRSAQWALDGRKKLPTLGEFREAIRSFSEEMIAGAMEFRRAVLASSHTQPHAHVMHRSAIGLEQANCFSKDTPKLVLTSPPYPGIHVLYHRWQVDGRKETAAPFWIANTLDGAGLSYYTFGHRHALENRPYFEQLAASFRSISAVCDQSTVIVQMVAFSQPSWQLPRYLEVMQEAGLEELPAPIVEDQQDGRLWRTIPNRKWHAGQLGAIPASQELVLFHRKKRR